MKTFTDVDTGRTYNYSKGDKFVYLEAATDYNGNFSRHSVLTLSWDDDSNTPQFTDESGFGAFEYLGNLKPLAKNRQFTLKDIQQLDIVTLANGAVFTLIGTNLINSGGHTPLREYSSDLSRNSPLIADISSVYRRDGQAWCLDELLDKGAAIEVYSRKDSNRFKATCLRISELKSERDDINSEIDKLKKSL